MHATLLRDIAVTQLDPQIRNKSLDWQTEWWCPTPQELPVFECANKHKELWRALNLEKEDGLEAFATWRPDLSPHAILKVCTALIYPQSLFRNTRRFDHRFLGSKAFHYFADVHPHLLAPYRDRLLHELTPDLLYYEDRRPQFERWAIRCESTRDQWMHREYRQGLADATRNTRVMRRLFPLHVDRLEAKQLVKAARGAYRSEHLDALLQRAKHLDQRSERAEPLACQPAVLLTHMLMASRWQRYDQKKALAHLERIPAWLLNHVCRVASRSFDLIGRSAGFDFFAVHRPELFQPHRDKLLHTMVFLCSSTDRSSRVCSLLRVVHRLFPDAFSAHAEAMTDRIMSQPPTHWGWLQPLTYLCTIAELAPQAITPEVTRHVVELFKAGFGEQDNSAVQTICWLVELLKTAPALLAAVEPHIAPTAVASLRALSGMSIVSSARVASLFAQMAKEAPMLLEAQPQEALVAFRGALSCVPPPP